MTDRPDLNNDQLITRPRICLFLFIRIEFNSLKLSYNKVLFGEFSLRQFFRALIFFYHHAKPPPSNMIDNFLQYHFFIFARLSSSSQKNPNQSFEIFLLFAVSLFSSENIIGWWLSTVFTEKNTHTGFVCNDCIILT